ncbi:MAG TPA: hypothetical protein VE781_17430 [Kineosporiaceae bacterium]|jgi:hypothetical protein|nr:hypothetical protein [Kineosporiaceae bacterium]
MNKPTVTAALLLAAVLPLTACGGSGSSAADGAAAKPAGAAGAAAAGTATTPDDESTAFPSINTQRPPCPFTAEQVTGIVGKAMRQDVECDFRGPNGVGIVSVDRHASNYCDIDRDQAVKLYKTVTDLPRGENAFIAARELEGEACVTATAGSFHVSISDFSSSPAETERLVRALVDAIPA